MDIGAKGLNLKDSTAITCESCQNDKFTEVYLIRKVSKLLSGAANDTIMPIPTFQCSSCGHINKEFTPKF
jgi:hypothetical protein